MNTRDIQEAIDECAQTGGGTVSLPPGVHEAGSLHLRSKVTLHLPATATLCQSREMADYEDPPAGSYAFGTGSRRVFLHGDGVHNVALVGEGTIDGNLAFDSDDKGGNRRGPLPILFENSRDIRIDGITVRDSPSWAITFFGCRKVDVTGVQCIDSQADGINPVCSQEVHLDDVLIEGSKDDPIAIKNEMAGAAPACGFLTEEISIRNVTIRNCEHPVVKIGTGTFGVFRNIAVRNCSFESTGAMLSIQLMSPEREDAPERAIENISFTDINMKDVSGLIDVTSLTVERPIIRNIHLENVVADGLKGRSAIWGSSQAPIENVMLRNIDIKGSAQPVRYWYSDMLPGSGKAAPYWLKTRYVTGLHLDRVDLLLEDTESGVICEDGKDVTIDGLALRDVAGKEGEGPVVTLHKVEGACVRNSKGSASRAFLRTIAETRDIRIEGNDWGGNAMPLEIAGDLPRDSIAPSVGEVSYSNFEVVKQVRANDGFTATLTLANKGAEGSFKAEVGVDGQVFGSQWIWLKQGETREVALKTKPCYLPGSHTISAGPLSATAEVLPSSAAFEFGERMQIQSPAAAGEMTVVTVPLKNIGGETGAKEVELLADGRVVASTEVTLAPGEQREITLEHSFGEGGPHELQVGDFPLWPYATFANCEAAFYQTREKIIIEAGGDEQHIVGSDRQYAAIYLKNVEGDFVADARLTVRHVTGPYCGGGVIAKNNMADPTDNSGCVIDWFYPKYAVCHYEDAQDRQVSREGETFSGLCQVSPEDAGSAQDVGVFAHAFSASGELCHVEIDHFNVAQE